MPYYEDRGPASRHGSLWFMLSSCKVGFRSFAPKHSQTPAAVDSAGWCPRTSDVLGPGPALPVALLYETSSYWMCYAQICSKPMQQRQKLAGLSGLCGTLSDVHMALVSPRFPRSKRIAVSCCGSKASKPWARLCADLKSVSVRKSPVCARDQAVGTAMAFSSKVVSLFRCHEPRRIHFR